MEFSEEKLQGIILQGATGSDYYSIAMNLGITPDKLSDLRKTDERLNDAINRADSNYKLYLKNRLEKKIDNLKSPIAKEFYLRLLDGDKQSDNEIIIREVE